jgi:hypothetical protein
MCVGCAQHHEDRDDFLPDLALLLVEDARLGDGYGRDEK